jgi:DHA2 family multidrug resistance protein
LDFLVLGYATWSFSDINLEVTSRSITWPNIISGFAMGFIFVPLTTMAMGLLSNEQMGNASGVFNLMRNTGGSLGIAAMTTMLGARRSNSPGCARCRTVNPYNPVLQQASAGVNSSRDQSNKAYAGNLRNGCATGNGSILH